MCQAWLQKWVVFAKGGAHSLYLWPEPVPAAGLRAAQQTALGTFLHFSLECPSLVPFQLPTLYRLHYTTAPFVM